MYGSSGDGPANGRIYVGSLPNMFTEKDVEREFERFGKIIKMDFKRTISGSGYCFLEYADPRDARDAIAQLHGRPPPGMRDAPPLRVEVPLSSRGGGEPGRGLPRGLTTRRGRFIVDIRGLPPTGSWQDLKDHFRRIGDVGYAEVWKDPEACDGSGVGEVSFFTRRDMMEAIEVLDGSTFRSHEGEKSRITVREKRIVGERDNRDRGDRDRGDGRRIGDSLGGGRSDDDEYEFGGSRGERGGGSSMRGSSRGGDGRKYSGGTSNGGGYHGGGGGRGYHHHPDYNGSSSRRGGDGYYDYYHNSSGGNGGSGGSPSPPPRSGDSSGGSGRYYGGSGGGGGYYDSGGSGRGGGYYDSGGSGRGGSGRGRSRSRERGSGGGRHYGSSSGRGEGGGSHDSSYGETLGNSSPSLRRAGAPGGRSMGDESGGSRGKYDGERERRRS